MPDKSLSTTLSYFALKKNLRSWKASRISVILLFLLFAGHVSAQNDKWQRLMTDGNVQQEKGQTIGAEKSYREALVIAEKFGSKDSRLAATLIKLASVCEVQAKHDEAYSLANRAVQVISDATNSYKTLKLDSASEKEYYKIESTVSILDSAAEIYSSQKKFDEAEPLLKMVATIREGTAQRKPPKSNEDFLAVMVQLMTGGPDKLFRAYENLATFYVLQGKDTEAKSLYKHALMYFEGNGDESGLSNQARVHIIFGVSYFKNGKFAEAEGSIESALKIYQKSEVAKDGYSAVALSTLATLYVKQEKYYDNARSYYRQALNIFQREGWKDRVEVADCFANYAILLRKSGNETEAVEMENRSRVIRDQLKKPNENR